MQLGCSNKNRVKLLPAQGADGADNGGSGAKRGHKRGGDGKDALNYRKNLFDGGKNLLLEEVLLLGGINGGTEVHFIYKGAKRFKGVMPYADIIIWGTCPSTPPPPHSATRFKWVRGDATVRPDEPCLGNRRFYDRERFGKP